MEKRNSIVTGASAGGFEAFRQLVVHLPPDPRNELVRQAVRGNRTLSQDKLLADADGLPGQQPLQPITLPHTSL